jgi:hypothetical protein
MAGLLQQPNGWLTPAPPDTRCHPRPVPDQPFQFLIPLTAVGPWPSAGVAPNISPPQCTTLWCPPWQCIAVSASPTLVPSTECKFQIGEAPRILYPCPGPTRMPQEPARTCGIVGPGL